MSLLALKAHFDGNAVVLDEPCHLPAATPLLVIVPDRMAAAASADDRLAAFQAVFGSLRGRLSSSEAFMARKREEKALEERR